MKLRSVIGAGYGDEGKGLAVDALAHQLLRDGEVTVVRVNGGAQAGHTVQTPDGRRHVFHQFGAGSLAGARTHWSSDFVASPMFWAAEKDELKAMGARTDAVTADPRVSVTTPWDVMINQAVEIARGGGKHGSCGMGFGETVERAERGWGLNLADLKSPDLCSRLNFIRNNWFPQRMTEHGLDPAPHAAIALDDAVLDRFLDDCRDMMSGVVVRQDAEIRGGVFGSLITEGAQGLGLDMSVGEFPHVTRSNTGLVNVVRFARQAGINEISVTYMTRAYATRHGAGPFSGEQDVSGWAEVVDPTNVPNGWQGSLRVGVLDLDEMAYRIWKDVKNAEIRDILLESNVGVSCLDQLTGPSHIITQGALIETATPEMAVSTRLRMPVGLMSMGPSRDLVRTPDVQESSPELT